MNWPQEEGNAGAPKPFAGKTFVLTGTLPTMSREAAKEAIEGTMRATAMIMLIVVAASFLNFVMSATGLTDTLFEENLAAENGAGLYFCWHNERHVLRNPTDVRGHLELARGYFYARDNPRARQEFEVGNVTPSRTFGPRKKHGNNPDRKSVV